MAFLEINSAITCKVKAITDTCVYLECGPIIAVIFEEQDNQIIKEKFMWNPQEQLKSIVTNNPINIGTYPSSA
jgi:hypothetical protein